MYMQFIVPNILAAYQSLYGHVVCNAPVSHKANGDRYQLGHGATVTHKVSKGAKIRNRYNQVPNLTQDTNGKVTSSQQTPQTRAKRSALSHKPINICSQNSSLILVTLQWLTNSKWFIPL